MSKNGLVKVEYQDMTVVFTEAAWFNATSVAERFGKTPYEWLRLPETERYLGALCRKHEVGKSHFVKTKRGGPNRGNPGSVATQGTWMHPKLAVAFARWLDLDFALWCDEQIDALIRGTHPHHDWKNIRYEATATYKVLGHVIQATRAAAGKETKHYHFANEARLINYALTGEFGTMDRDTLSEADLGLLARLALHNTSLIAINLPYAERKVRLEEYSRFLTQRPALHTEESPNV